MTGVIPAALISISVACGFGHPPTGTVTFLFTDIEGSTKRWEQYPQQMKTALQHHDSILRSTIEAEGVHVFKAVEGRLESISAVLDREARLPYERADAMARSLLAEEAFERAWQEGRGISMEQAIEYALE